MIDSARTSRNLTLPSINQDDLKYDPFPTLRNWFSRIEKIVPQKRILLCLDEFERLEEVITVTNSRAPLNFFRHLIQDKPAWTLLFSGSHTLDEIEDYWSDYLINTRSVFISYLKEDEAEELIKHPVPDFPDIYLPETVKRIIYWTRCQPYLVQLLCSELVYYLNEKYPENSLNSKATPEDVDNIIDPALISGGQYFHELWKISLTKEQRNCIIDMVEVEKCASLNPKILGKLVEKEIIEKKGENFRFQVPLIERSIRAKIEEEASTTSIR
ncbi:MAG: hypothetical protein WBM32_08040 [Crocosphaera sp.]